MVTAHPLILKFFVSIQFVCSVVHMLVSVHWYSHLMVDHGSGLTYVNLNTQNASVLSVVHLRDISKPLMHAVDELDPTKLGL